MASSNDKSGWSLPTVPDKVKTYGPSLLVGGVVVATFPFVLSSFGFTVAGIAAGSLAAKLMSVSAVANGGGVAAGGVVATCQSIGAAGLGLAGKAAVGGASAGIFSFFSGTKSGEKK